MWWDKKGERITPRIPRTIPPPGAPSATSKLDNIMSDNKTQSMSSSSLSPKQTSLGSSMALRGELSGTEDLMIDGQFEGTLNLPDHCLTVGSQGQVKAEVHARNVVVFGSVHGNIAAREKIEIRRSGQVVGDLITAGVVIEEGAYLKGSIDIQREDSHGTPRSVSTKSVVKTSA